MELVWLLVCGVEVLVFAIASYLVYTFHSRYNAKGKWTICGIRSILCCPFSFLTICFPIDVISYDLIHTPQPDEGYGAVKQPQHGDGAIEVRTEEEKAPAEGVIARCRALRRAFGTRFLVYLVLVKHLLSGLINAFDDGAGQYVFMAFAVPAGQMTLLNNIVGLPALFTVLVGVMSDVVPIYGFTKGPYLIIVLLIGTVGYLGVAVGTAQGNAGTAMPLIAVVFFSIAKRLYREESELFIDSLVVEKAGQRPAEGGDLVLFSNAGMVFWKMVGFFLLQLFTLQTFQKDTASYPGLHFIFFICATGTLLAVIPTFLNHMGETRKTHRATMSMRTQLRGHWYVFGIIMIVVAVSSCSTVISFYTLSNFCSMCVTMAAAVATGCLIAMTLRKDLAGLVIYMLCSGMLDMTYSIQGASMYFFTDNSNMYPSGPALPASYISSTLPIVVQVSNLVGLLAYGIMNRWTCRSCLQVAVATKTCFTVVAAMQFARLNTMVGISDYAVKMFVDCGQGVSGMWPAMAATVYMSETCPLGMTATIWALMQTCQSVGNSACGFMSAWVLDMFAVQPTGTGYEPDEFKNLWKVGVIAAVLDIVMLVIVFPIFPKSVKEGLHNLSATYNSPVARWLKLSPTAPGTPVSQGGELSSTAPGTPARQGGV